MAALNGLADLLVAPAPPQNTKKSKIEDVFAEEPVSLDVFVQDKRFLGNPPLSPIQYDFVRHFEQVFYQNTYKMMVEEFGPYWEPVRFVNFMVAQWGKGSGKDHTCRVSVARVAYLLMCLKSPQAYYGMPAQDEIQMINVAASSQQAQTAFFKPLRTMLAKSPWFQDKFSGDIPGEQATRIRLKKQIELISGHSMADTMEGLNLLTAIADEISAFKTKDELERFNPGGREPAKSAESILKMLRTSARTRFPGNFKMAQISFPRFKGDAIQQATMRGMLDLEKRGEKSRTYISGPLATWEVNPRVKGKEEFQEDYDEDPAMARGMYECDPDFSPNRYFKDDVAVTGAFAKQIPEPIKIEYTWGFDQTVWEDQPLAPKRLKIPGWQANYAFDPTFMPMYGVSYAVHGDLAITGDRAGVAMCHVRTWDRRTAESEWGEAYEMRPVVKVDFVTCWEADLTAKSPDGQEAPREVQIRWFRQLVFELQRRGFNIGLVTLDGFQSADTIQILEARGVEARKQSTVSDLSPWKTMQDLMYDSRLEGYFHGELIRELRALTLLPNGKVDHPPGGSKDMADAVAASCMGCIELGGDEGEDPEPVGAETGAFMTMPRPQAPPTSMGMGDLGPPSSLMGSETGGMSWQDLGALPI